MIMHYEYEWIVTVEVIAETESESKKKLAAFKSKLFEQYAETDDIWLTGIKRAKGRGGSNLYVSLGD
jgi:hypothetical protein